MFRYEDEASKGCLHSPEGVINLVVIAPGVVNYLDTVHPLAGNTFTAACGATEAPTW